MAHSAAYFSRGQLNLPVLSHWKSSNVNEEPLGKNVFKFVGLLTQSITVKLLVN